MSDSPKHNILAGNYSGVTSRTTPPCSECVNRGDEDKCWSCIRPLIQYKNFVPKRKSVLMITPGLGTNCMDDLMEVRDSILAFVEKYMKNKTKCKINHTAFTATIGSNFCTRDEAVYPEGDE